MLLVLKRIGIVGLIAVVFLFGLATTVYLSLRSPEVRVPEVVGKDRVAAENDLQAAGLNFRVRATRPSRQIKPDVVMFQLPSAGQVVKAGQTVAVDIARNPKEGEASEAFAGQENSNAGNENKNANQSSAAANANENRPKRNRNANANANGNANANKNTNGNRNANANGANANVRVNGNGNANAVSSGSNTNSRKPQNENANPTRPNRNANRATPKPTPPERR